MYVPPAFSVVDRTWALGLIAAYPFGLLTSCDGGAVQATHVPMFAREREGKLFIAGHVARANPHADAILARRSATAIFTGPHAYVSPSWYEEPYATVPTWNYATVHASGQLRESDAREVLDALVAMFEAQRPQPWSLDGLDDVYLEKQIRGIVAFELRVEVLASNAKLSQNRTAADRERVIAELERSQGPGDRECAQAMRSAPTR